MCVCVCDKNKSMCYGYKGFMEGFIYILTGCANSFLSIFKIINLTGCQKIRNYTKQSDICP